MAVDATSSKLFSGPAVVLLNNSSDSFKNGGRAGGGKIKPKEVVKLNT